MRLDVTIIAPVLILPLGALSNAAFIADLGKLSVTNQFLHATSDSGESLVSASGEKALLDRMAISLSSIQLGRCVYSQYIHGQ